MNKDIDIVKLIEFKEEADFTKFDKLCKLKFSDGTNMGSWFNDYTKEIFILKDINAAIIRMQYKISKDCLNLEDTFKPKTRNTNYENEIIYGESCLNEEKANGDLILKLHYYD